MQLSWSKDELYCFEGINVTYIEYILKNFCKVTDRLAHKHDYDDRFDLELKNHHRFRMVYSISEHLSELIKFYKERVDLKYESGLIALNPSALNSKTNGLELHSDRSKLDNILHRRCYSCVLYINDDYEGGEIGFPLQNKIFKPKPGTLLTYPSDLRYCHYVKKVTEGTKFILQGYLTVV